MKGSKGLNAGLAALTAMALNAGCDSNNKQEAPSKRLLTPAEQCEADAAAQYEYNNLRVQIGSDAKAILERAYKKRNDGRLVNSSIHFKVSPTGKNDKVIVEGDELDNSAEIVKPGSLEMSKNGYAFCHYSGDDEIICAGTVDHSKRYRMEQDCLEKVWREDPKVQERIRAEKEKFRKELEAEKARLEAEAEKRAAKRKRLMNECEAEIRNLYYIQGQEILESEAADKLQSILASAPDGELPTELVIAIPTYRNRLSLTVPKSLDPTFLEERKRSEDAIPLDEESEKAYGSHSAQYNLDIEFQMPKGLEQAIKNSSAELPDLTASFQKNGSQIVMYYGVAKQDIDFVKMIDKEGECVKAKMRD